MKLWFSKTGEKQGRPWRVRMSDGSEGLCSNVKAVGLCSTVRIPAEEVTEGAWAVELPDPPGSVLLDFVPTAGKLLREAAALPGRLGGAARGQGRRGKR